MEKLRGFLEGWDPKTDLEAWNRGEADLSLFDPKMAYEDTILPDHAGETYQGYEGVARATERWLEPFEALTVELDRIVGTGDRLVSIHRVQMQGPTYRYRHPSPTRLRLVLPRRTGNPLSSLLRTPARPSKPPGCRSSRFGREAAIRFAWKGVLFDVALPFAQSSGGRA